MNKKLSRKIGGFSGITHLLIGISLFLILFLLPFDFFGNYIETIKSNWRFLISAFVIVSGACLLPDLDNEESTAGYQLGLIGKFMKVSMKIIASAIYNLYHLKNDRPPKSMHRLFWHTPFISICFILLFWFMIPEGNISIFNLIKSNIENKTILDFIIKNITLFICIFFIFVSTLLGSNILLYWPLKILPISWRIKSIINLVVPILILINSFTLNTTQLRYLGVSVGLGYLFHIIGDAFSQGSAPLLWPIPIKHQAWFKPNILGPFMIKTGGTVNMILNFAFAAIDALLIYFLVK